MLVISASLLVNVLQKSRNDDENIIASIHWTDLLGSVYNKDRFEDMLAKVEYSSQDFAALVPVSSDSKYELTFIPQVHYIQSFESTLNELAAEMRLKNTSDLEGLIHQKILTASAPQVNNLARVLEVYNSQLAIFDYIVREIESSEKSKPITVFVESLQYGETVKSPLPSKNGMAHYLIREGAAQLVKALYPSRVNLVGTELMDQHALATSYDGTTDERFIKSKENLSELYSNCIGQFKSEKIRYESKCYRLLIMRQREANAVAAVKHYLQKHNTSKVFLIFGAAHPMPLYTDLSLKIEYPDAMTLSPTRPLLRRQLRALSGLNKLLFTQARVAKDYSITQKFAYLLADVLLRKRINKRELSLNANSEINNITPIKQGYTDNELAF